MNTLKPLMICAVLAGIGYGVYVRINSGSDAPPPGVSDGWNNVPEVQLSDSAPGAAPAAIPGAAPSWPGAGGPAANSAPPFANQQAAPATAGQVAAPPYQPDAVAASAPPLGASTDIPPVGSAQMPQEPGPGNPYNQPAEQAPGAAPQQPAVVDNAAPSPDAAVPDRYQTAAGAVPDRYRAAETAPGAAPPQAPADGSFADSLAAARHELEAGQMTAALEQLSNWYDDPRLSPAERQQLNQLLDQVAGTVIYSTQHLLEPPYEVQPGERLEDIGQRYNVPWKLLAKINGIEDPNGLRPGERLKVIRGPFSATISLEKRELTLMLANGSYAGRFPIGIGIEQPPREGTFAVSDKVVDPVYHGREKAVGAGDQGNPYGQRWIGLGSDLGIHGTNRAENIGRTDLPGSISLSPHDIEDVFDILATGSKVTIRR